MKAFLSLVAERLRRHTALLTLIGLAALGAAAYSNSLHNGFQFDDNEGIVHNAVIRDLRYIPSYFTNVQISTIGSRDWRPVVVSTYALNYALSGLDPLAFHITNLLIHIGVAWLIFLVAAAVIGDPSDSGPENFSGRGARIAAIAAALFTVHTVNSEAVNYAWARSSTLAALLLLASFYSFLQGAWNQRDKASFRWYLAGLVLFVIGLGAKATVVTLPAILVLHETLFLNQRRQNPLTLYWKEPRRLAKYLPVAGVAAAYIVFRFFFLRGFFRRVAYTGAGTGVTATTYLLTQFRAWIYYVRLFLWPEPLITDYPGFGWSRSLWETNVLLSLGAIVIILIVAWSARRLEPALTFFVLWFFVVLLPEASFIPLYDAVTGYRAYPANAGLSVVAALLTFAAATRLWRRIKGADSRLWTLYGTVWVLILCVLTAATISRNRVWKDPESMWSDVIAKDPTNSRAYTNLALSRMENEDYQKAQELLEKAVTLDPKKSSPYLIRGYLAFVLHQNEQALSDLTKAIELNPRAPDGFYYRGEVYRNQREYDKALADYKSALALHPFYTDVYMGKALVHMDRKEIDEAIEVCTKFTEIDRRDPRGYTCLGILFLEQHRAADAVRTYQRGVFYVPRDSGLWYGLGVAYQENQMYREAGDAFEQSARLTR